MDKSRDAGHAAGTQDELQKDASTYKFITQVTGGVTNFSASCDEEEESPCDLYLQFLETFKVGVCLVDRNQTIQFANSKALKLLRCQDLDQIMARPYTDFFPLDQARIQRFHARYQDRDWTPSPLQVTRFDKIPTTMQVNISFDYLRPLVVVGIYFSTG